jgi:uncharacterized membrane protein
MKKINENVLKWIYLSVLSVFITILVLTMLSVYYLGTSSNIPSYLLIFVEYHIFFMFFIAICGAIFGSLTQVMTSKRIESDEMKFENLKKYFLKSLEYNEKKIIDYLLINHGVCTQYELTKLENLNKLKVSRMIIELEKKKFVSKKNIGKINKIYLSDDLISILKS